MSSYRQNGFAVVATDVLMWDTGSVYRFPRRAAAVVHLQVSLEEALRRAATRPVHLTDAEFRHLHGSERGAEVADAHVDATRLSLAQLTTTVAELWRRDGSAAAAQDSAQH
jgi:hypothetical protein